jgi:uncharacterized protein (UPF0332 family)
MNPHEFLDLAAEWSTGPSEGEWRSAVSRAYYAAFHVAQDLLRQVGFAVPQDDQAHAYAWLRLANSGNPDVQRAGNDLNELRRMRNRADYDLQRPFEQRTAIDFVLSATSIVELLEDLARTQPVLDRILAAIRDYERDVLREVTWHA